MNLVVLISGNGSNLQAMIDAARTDSNTNIAAVISNQADAYGLERAKKSNIPTHIISHREFESRDAFDKALSDQIDAYQPDLIALAGFMRRLGSNFVARYLGKTINIHPSLLPKYPGLLTHIKALEAGDKQHGATIHFVTDDLDAGPLICQAALDIRPDDDENTLKARVQKLEHRMYPKVIRLFAKGRIRLEGNRVYFDDKRLEKPLTPTIE